MGCINSHNSIHPASPPVGESNPSFDLKVTSEMEQELPVTAPNSSPEMPVRRDSFGKVLSPSALEALSSQLENNKTFYRPKLVKQISSSNDDVDGGYNDALQLLRNHTPQSFQKFDKTFESLLEAELEHQDQPVHTRRRTFPQKPVETESQKVFFKMLDKKIAEGPDYVPD